MRAYELSQRHQEAASVVYEAAREVRAEINALEKARAAVVSREQSLAEAREKLAVAVKQEAPLFDDWLIQLQAERAEEVQSRAALIDGAKATS